MTQRYFEDVNVNDEIEPVDWTPTTDMAAGFTAGGFGGPPAPGAGPGGNRFTDEAGGRAIGVKGALVPGNMKMAVLAKFVSDWAGTTSQLSNVRVAFRRPDVAGTPLTLSGRVVDKRTEDGKSIVELEVVSLADGQPSVRANIQVLMSPRP